MNKTITAAITGMAMLASAQFATAQTFFVEDFDSTDPSRYLMNLTQYRAYYSSLGNPPRDIASEPWDWASYRQTSSLLSFEEANSELTLYSNSNKQSHGGGFLTHKSNVDFNFFGSDGSDPATFRRVFVLENIQVTGNRSVDASGNPTYTGPLADNYFVLHFLVSSGQGWLENGSPSSAPNISAWFDGAKGFGLSVSRYTPASLAAFNPYTVTVPLVSIPGATVPLVPTSMRLEMGPQTYKMVFIFTGGGLYFEGEHGLDKATWHWHQVAQSNPTNPDNFYLGVGASVVSKQIGYTIAKIGKVSVTDGQP
ncbi:MAG: hypothetical protein OEZ43_03350 [Gammaproteobacteria bacterium]|nr:hypothetical protein [Gammaproteobacteria bacterium]